MVRTPAQPITAAQKIARRAWRLQHREAKRSAALADEALAKARAAGDLLAEALARLTRGFHLMRYATTAQAKREFGSAKRCFEAAGDIDGPVLAATGVARCLWLEGRYRESLVRALPLRAAALRLKREDRGVVLNAIAGCYSALGDSEHAFAYMVEALRESGPARGHGFDIVLYCNIAHELYQIGDYHEALRYLAEGVDRCSRLDNPRLLTVLLTNRIICLTDLGRAADALPDVRQVLALPDDDRGTKGAAFEVLAVAALRSGDLVLGDRLVEQATESLAATSVPDERIGLAVAQAERSLHHGLFDAAAATLEGVHAQCAEPIEGLGVRVRCLYFQLLADVQQALARPHAALAALRAWQRLQVERTQLASRARHQAAMLQTELLHLRHQLDDSDARRRSTERARAELEAINRELSNKVEQVQKLQAALEQQATRDFLTGLFNRRHLNDVLPSMLALAARDRQPLAVAIIDLDHFKAVNDLHGHAAGDRLLAGFGELLRGRCRKSDVACRYGGEEFCLILPRTGATATRRKLNGLLRVWRQAVFDVADATLTGRTFSAGVVDTQCAPPEVDALLKAADEALLAAKRLGRNRVVVGGTALSPQAATV